MALVHRSISLSPGTLPCEVQHSPPPAAAVRQGRGHARRRSGSVQEQLQEPQLRRQARPQAALRGAAAPGELRARLAAGHKRALYPSPTFPECHNNGECKRCAFNLPILSPKNAVYLDALYPESQARSRAWAGADRGCGWRGTCEAPLKGR